MLPLALLLLWSLAGDGQQYWYPNLDSAPNARANMLCIFALHRVSILYVGPTLCIRRQDNAESDFYADVYGNMGTTLNGGGTTLTSWLGESNNAYVTKWYDQSYNNREATQATQSFQPIYDPSSKVISFDSDDFFNANLACVPYGNTAYTIITRHGTVPISSNAFCVWGRVIMGISNA